MTVLLATVGAWAQGTADYEGIYTLGVDVNKQRGYVCAGEGWPNYPVLTEITLKGYTGNSVDPVADGKNWYVKASADNTGYYLYNVAVGKFLVNSASNQVDFGDTPQIWGIADNGAYKKIVRPGTTNQYLSGGCSRSAANRPMAYDTNAGDGGAKYTIEAVDNGTTTFATQIAEADAKIAEVEPVSVTIYVKNGDEAAQLEHTAMIVRGTEVTLRDYLPTFSFVTYANTTATVTASGETFTLGYTVDTEAESAVPFATSYDELNRDGKWVSLYTLNGRMHVRDVNEDGSNVAKYPTIDKATFTRLNDNYFWGFVRASRFSPIHIVNKAAGENQSLYLTSNGDNVPVLLATEASKGANWVTNEWVLEKSTKATATATGDKYYGIRAQGTNKYINNYANQGFMTTWHDGQNKDDGSNHKFIGELETYDILKERALKAPCNAVHSLNAAARQAIKDNTDNTVASYQAVIAEINQTTGSETGYIEFDETKYYVLRNYTPEGGNVYVLGSDNGTASCTFTVPADQAGDADNAMTYSNINAIWKIEKNGEAAGGDGLGASRTTPRRLSHVNSAKTLSAITDRSLVEAASAANYYFVDLGAGQHFLKNVQYSGTGNQAKAKPLSCADDGTLKVGGDRHLKNSRDTWYGIPVSDIKVTIGAAGYASLHLPFGVDLPAGEALKAYAVTGVTAATATLTEVTSVPANQGVILKGAAGTYSLTINDAAAWEVESNLLRGSNMHDNVTDEAYVLSMPADATEAGFYKAAMTGGSWLNNDNKAYLPANVILAGAPSLSFVFDMETGVEGVDAAKAGKPSIHDLSGRRVKGAQKGIYIINGKKVVK